MPNNAIGPQKGEAYTFTFAADTEPYLRVYVNSSGQAAIAGADDRSAGVNGGNGVDVSEYALGDVLFHHQCAFTVMKASGAISAGAKVFAAASGKVASSGSVCEGTAIDAASADGDLIRVIPMAVQLPGIAMGTVTVSAGQAAANSGDGQATITTGFGVATFSYFYKVKDVSNGLTVNTGYAEAYGASAGDFVISGVSAGVQLDAGDIIEWCAIRRA